MRPLFSCLLILICFGAATAKTIEPTLYTADNANFQYVGRIDFSNKLKPRFWSPGVYIRARFKGPECHVLINDEVMWGKSHNYIEIVVDDKPGYRIKLTGKENDIKVDGITTDGVHVLTICKDTESGIGYLDFVGLKCEKLLPPPAQPKHKIEYIGDSITAGAGMDESQLPCGKGEWYEQHNAYMSYGPATSRKLNAEWQLTAVAGIGMIHSCCDMGILMPQVFDKMNLRQDTLAYNFNYKPDVVTICLGQNDGIQDSVKFCSAYVDFVHSVRKHYPSATIILCSSPMADAKLVALLKSYLAGIADQVNKEGDKNLHVFYFSKQYSHGCGGHPDLAEHQLMATELAAEIKYDMGW